MTELRFQYGLRGHLTGWFFTGVCLWLGGVGVWTAGGNCQLAIASLKWPTVPGKVIVSKRALPASRKQARIRYEYTVDGILYKSEQISFGRSPLDRGGRNGLGEIHERYPLGKTVKVFYSADNPERAILEPGDVSEFPADLFIGLVYFLGGCWGVWWCIRDYCGLPIETDLSNARRWVRNRTILVSILFYLVGAFLILESYLKAQFQAGPQNPVNLSVLLIRLSIFSVLYLPIPIANWHLFKLFHQGRLDADAYGEKPKAAFRKVVKRHPHLRRSDLISKGVFLSAVAALIIWLLITGDVF